MGVTKFTIVSGVRPCGRESASDPKIANNPLVIAALANAKASDAAFYAALENMEAKRTFFHRWSAYRHFRQASLKAEKAHDALRAAVERARANLK